MTGDISYYQKVLEVTKDYLGPAAERFLLRQIHSHLGKDPHFLSKNDIHSLAIRVRSGLLVLTHDEAVVDEAYHRIAAIGDR